MRPSLSAVTVIDPVLQFYALGALTGLVTGLIIGWLARSWRG